MDAFGLSSMVAHPDAPTTRSTMTAVICSIDCDILSPFVRGSSRAEQDAL